MDRDPYGPHPPEGSCRLGRSRGHGSGSAFMVVSRASRRRAVEPGRVPECAANVLVDDDPDLADKMTATWNASRSAVQRCIRASTQRISPTRRFRSARTIIPRSKPRGIARTKSSAAGSLTANRPKKPSEALTVEAYLLGRVLFESVVDGSVDEMLSGRRRERVGSAFASHPVSVFREGDLLGIWKALRFRAQQAVRAHRSCVLHGMRDVRFRMPAETRDHHGARRTRCLCAGGRPRLCAGCGKGMFSCPTHAIGIRLI